MSSSEKLDNRESLNELLEKIEEERPQDVHILTSPPEMIPDEEDLEQLINECYETFQLLMDVDLPEEIFKLVQHMHNRLETIQGWEIYH